MTRKQYKTLKYLYWNNRFKIKVTSKKIYKMCNRKENEALPSKILPYVIEEQKVSDIGEINRTGYISINDAGIAYVETQNTESKDMIFNRAIAVAALIISIIALLKP